MIVHLIVGAALIIFAGYIGMIHLTEAIKDWRAKRFVAKLNKKEDKLG